MKSKTIWFCIRGIKNKSKEKKVEDLGRVSNHVKPDHKGRTKGSASTVPVGDGGGGINVHGSNTIGSIDSGVTTAVVAATHLSMMSVTTNEGQDGISHDHGGESGAHAAEG
ncbi:uncharacterized protein LOC109805422 [Cajanus cajan]|uniref:uncharacterized protein LOC109805422 n=1 Tax=Cajanus cajan TaxID=3821 RepID=UPI00098DB112|nr:uncharacterized protein LOC109805422 [Cajanus cajan]